MEIGLRFEHIIERGSKRDPLRYRTRWFSHLYRRRQSHALISYGGRKTLSVGASPEEQAEAFKTFLAYTGRYALSGDKVTHHIEISSIQNYVGKDLVRSVKFQGDQITLLTPPTLVNGKIQTIELVWQRLRDDSDSASS